MAISFQYLYTWIEWVEKQANKKKTIHKSRGKWIWYEMNRRYIVRNVENEEEEEVVINRGCRQLREQWVAAIYLLLFRVN